MKAIVTIGVSGSGKTTWADVHSVKQEIDSLRKEREILK